MQFNTGEPQGSILATKKILIFLENSSISRSLIANESQDTSSSPLPQLINTKQFLEETMTFF